MIRFIYTLLFFCFAISYAAAQLPCIQPEPSDLIPGGTPSQSSIDGTSGPTIATDGIKTGSWTTGNASRTLDENGAWWEIDLGEVYALESVTIWYPADVYPQGFADYYILYSRYPFSGTDLAGELIAPEVNYLHVESSFATGTSFPINFESARYVRIQNGGGGVMSLNEIEIPGRPIEVCGNDCDDDGDGLTDCEDRDCSPNLYNVVETDPSCPICPDGGISIQAFGENIEYSIDGGQTFEPLCSGVFLCEIGHLAAGDYDILIRNDHECIIEWPGNPVQLRGPEGGQHGHCPNGGFEDGMFNEWVGGIGGWVDIDGGGFFSGDYVEITDVGFALNERHTIINGILNPDDPRVPGINLTPPSGGTYIAKLGNDMNGHEAESLTYCFMVDVDNTLFNFYFLPVLEDFDHPPELQPFFEYTLSNASGVIASEKIVAESDNSFFQVYDPFPDNPTRAPITYRTWTCVDFDLSSYIGEEVCITFLVADCAQPGHFGYVYIDALCDPTPLPVLDIEQDNYLCEGSKNEFVIDGSGTIGENFYTWEVCELTASGVEQNCFSEEFFNDVGTLDVKAFYVEKGGVWECGKTFRVKLDAENDCGIGNGIARDLTVACDLVVDYPDFIYCTDENIVPIQGTNNCSDCTFLWETTDLAILDDYTVPFPNIVAFPPGNGYLDLTVSVVDNTTGCCFEDEVKVKRLSEPDIVSVTLDQSDLCYGKIRALFWATIPIDYLKYTLKNQTTNQLVSGQFGVNPNNSDMYIATYTVPLIEDVTYTFSLGVEHPEFAGLDQYGCVDSEDITVGAFNYQGDLSDVFFPSVFDPTKIDPLEQEWIVLAPVIESYNAYFYELNIYDRWGAVVYSKSDLKDYGDPPFSFDEIRYDGKIRSCTWNNCHEEDPGIQVDANGECPGVQSDLIPCNDSYWDDPYAVCFDECGKPRYWQSQTTFTYWLKLENCSEVKLFEGSFGILY